MRPIVPAALLVTLVAPVLAQSDTARVISAMDEKRDAYGKVALQIWSFAEVGYQEPKSSALLQEQLKAAGFALKSRVAEIPIAFVAS